jgi:phosphohistidine phosphatase
MTADKLYFAQHGIAVSKNDDPERPLSKEGISQTKAIAKQLRQLDIPVSAIFHSDKLRAQQTADIFSSTLNLASMSELDHLSPGSDLTLIDQTFTKNNALYIGHLPNLEKIVSSLVTGDAESNIIKFQNSAVIGLEKSGDYYQVDCYLTPQLICE